MYSQETFGKLFSPVRQAVIVADGAKIIFANPAAKAAFGDSICDKPIHDLMQPEILDNQCGN